MLAAVKARLEAQVPDLAGRVGLAVDFARLTQSGAQPSGGVNAWVLPSGAVGKEADVMTGCFEQPVRESITVVSMLRSTDAAGERALDRLDGFLADIRRAVCGWTPEATTVGVFELASERPATSATRGALVYMSEFRINDRVRVST